MKKIKLKKILSKFNLLSFIEFINFQGQKWKNRKSNKEFKKNNPKVKLPPDFYLYETFNLNYEKFFTNGKPTATWLVNHMIEFKDFKNLSILDWGCGTGRVLRHLPAIINSSNSFYGSDYNKKYIKWCSENLEGIQFKNNFLKIIDSTKITSFVFSSSCTVYGVPDKTPVKETASIKPAFSPFQRTGNTAKRLVCFVCFSTQH